jgi:2-C-methyl-D-erythritol 2,4-cyclodiphosphate synthase
MRIGLGYDIHRLVTGRPLIIGGVRIDDAPKGAEGWSDADALTHAICDALLGAAALGDIGYHFPPGDPSFKGVDSQKLLLRVRRMVEDKGFRIVNVDAVVMLEKPYLKPHKAAMARILGESMGVPPDCVCIKATTNEGMDAVGHGEAIAAQAVALLEPVR